MAGMKWAMTMVIATMMVVGSAGNDDGHDNSGDNAGSKKRRDDGGMVVLTRVDSMTLILIMNSDSGDILCQNHIEISSK